MSDIGPASTTTLSILLTVIISGGIVAGLFEWFRNWVTKRREEYIDMSKIRLDSLSKSIPYYSRMRTYQMLLWTELEKDSIDSALSLYYICNIVNLTDEYMETVGGWQLDNLQAETIIQECLAYLFDELLELGYPDINKMIYAAKDNRSYHSFRDMLSNNKDFYERFTKWLMKEKRPIELAKRSRWFYELLSLELYHCYKLWYGEEPSPSDLSKDTIEYIKTKYPKYFKRITSFKKKSLRVLQ
jgi:hypothetical protein